MDLDKYIEDKEKKLRDLIHSLNWNDDDWLFAPLPHHHHHSTSSVCTIITSSLLRHH